MGESSTVVHTRTAPMQTFAMHERFQCERLGLIDAPGSKLGAGLFRVAPGQTAFPHHRHHGNDESIYILNGQGTLRLDGEEHGVQAGDYIALPALGPAHQLRNTGHDPLEYLCFSTRQTPEVVDYPDSGKVAAMAPQPILGQERGGHSAVIFFAKDAVDYFHGE